MLVCMLYLLASALAPFHFKVFVEMLVTFGQSSQMQRIIHRTFDVNVEHCSLKCSLRLTRALVRERKLYFDQIAMAEAHQTMRFLLLETQFINHNLSAIAAILGTMIETSLVLLKLN